MYYLFKRMIRISLLTVITIVCSLTATCQVVNDSLQDCYPELTRRELNICDSTELQCTEFKPQQIIIPGALIVSGLSGTIDHNNNMNRSVNDAMTDLSNGKQCKIDDYLRFVPSAAHLIM